MADTERLTSAESSTMAGWRAGALLAQRARRVSAAALRTPGADCDRRCQPISD